MVCLTVASTKMSVFTLPSGVQKIGRRRKREREKIKGEFHDQGDNVKKEYC
jgi:hypothetical protein